MNGLVFDLPDERYHSRPELSSTGARLLLPEFGGSPAKFKYRQGRDYTSAAFDVGKAVHAQVLGVGAQAVAYPDDVLDSRGAASTKAAKEWAEGVRAEGMVPMKAAELRPVYGMAEAVLKHPTSRALFELPGHREVSVFSEIDGVPVRARFDALTDATPQGVFGIDLKTTGDSASADAFTKTVVKFGYHLQQEWYRETLGADIRFAFVVVETAAPYLVAVHELGPVYQDMGRTLSRVARSLYADCVATNTWPGHPEEVQVLEPPVWAAMAHEERYELSSEIRI